MNKLREQYEATGVMTETGVKYFKYTYTQWLEARDEEHLTKIEKEVRHRKRYQQKCTDLLSEAKKMEKDLAFSVKYRNKLEKALFEGGEHPELPTLKQFIEDAPRVWYSHKSERALRCGQMYSDRVMIDQGWVKVALLELKDGE